MALRRGSFSSLDWGCPFTHFYRIGITVTSNIADHARASTNSPLLIPVTFCNRYNLPKINPVEGIHHINGKAAHCCGAFNRPVDAKGNETYSFTFSHCFIFEIVV